jgi:tetratricopeptide (TPR) repeat protein
MASQAAALAAAFEAYDLPVLRLDPRDAVERVAASPIRETLLAGLVCYLSNPSIGPAEEKKLTEILRRVDSDPWRQQASAASARNDWDGLLRLAGQPAALRQPPAYWHRLCDRVVRKDPPTAVALLRQAQRRHPDDFWINAYLGVYLLNWVQPRQPGEAISFLRAAVALRPQSPGARLNLGKAHWKQGQWDEAIAEYRQALQLKKDYAEAHFNLGLALEKKGRRKEAITAYCQAVRLKKDFADAHYLLSAALGREGQWDEAIADGYDQYTTSDVVQGGGILTRARSRSRVARSPTTAPACRGRSGRPTRVSSPARAGGFSTWARWRSRTVRSPGTRPAAGARAVPS